MKKLFQRNQIIITALAIMIAAAGYLNYAQRNVVNDKLDSAGATVGSVKEETKENGKKEEAKGKEQQGETQKAEEQQDASNTEPGEAVYTGTNIVSYIAQVKLNREQTRAKSKQSLMEVVNSSAVTEEQRQQAVDKMMKLTEMAQKEAEAESLLNAQGYKSVVVNVSENSVDVIMDMKDVDDAARAQIEDSIKRATEYSADKIIITPLEEN